MFDELFLRFGRTPAAQDLLRRVEAGGALTWGGVAGAGHAFVAAWLGRAFPHRPIVLVAENLKAQETLHQDLQTWLKANVQCPMPNAQCPDAVGHEAKPSEAPPHPPSPIPQTLDPIPHPLLFFPAWEILPHEDKLPHADVISERLETLVALSQNPFTHSPSPISCLISASITALLQRTFLPAQFAARTRTLRCGERVDPLDLVEWLEDNGYESEVQVSAKGEMALRGGIVDIFPLTSPWPVRLEFFGDELESLRTFDPVTQVSREGGELGEIVLPPAGELGVLKREVGKGVISNQSAGSSGAGGVKGNVLPHPGPLHEPARLARAVGRWGEAPAEPEGCALLGCVSPQGRASGSAGASPHQCVAGSRAEIAELRAVGSLPLGEGVTSAAPAATPQSQPPLATLLDYLPDDAIVILADPEAIEAHALAYAEQVPVGSPFFASWQELRGELLRRGMPVVALMEEDVIPGSEVEAEVGSSVLGLGSGGAGSGVIGLADRPFSSASLEALPLDPRPQTPDPILTSLEAFRPILDRLPAQEVALAQRQAFFQQLASWLRQGFYVQVTCNNDGEAQRFREVWEEMGLGGGIEAVSGQVQGPEGAVHFSSLCHHVPNVCHHGQSWRTHTPNVTPHEDKLPPHTLESPPHTFKSPPHGLKPAPHGLESPPHTNKLPPHEDKPGAYGIESASHASKLTPHASKLASHEAKVVSDDLNTPFQAENPSPNRPDGSHETPNEPPAEPSPFAQRGEKVAEGRMRGGATRADAANPSPRPSPLSAKRERSNGLPTAAISALEPCSRRGKEADRPDDPRFRLLTSAATQFMEREFNAGQPPLPAGIQPASASPPPELARRAWAGALQGLALGTLARGFLCAAARFVVVTDAEVFGRYKVQRPRRMKSSHAIAARSALDIDFTELQEGDYVVHLQHGIARFRGLKFLPTGKPARPKHELEAEALRPEGRAANDADAGRARLSQRAAEASGRPTGALRTDAPYPPSRTEEGIECLVLEYAPSDTDREPPKLYVPITEAHLVSKYVGAGKLRPPLNTLGGKKWEKAKQHAERAVRDLASELLAIQAKRATQPGHAFGPDTPWQREFEGSFLFEETPDQLRAIEETKRDLEVPKPMDRLICGDVGFGKTEVAIRAAFKAVMGGRQVAVLVPTTVLAQQHYNTFRERMADYPVRVELLSRYRTKKEQLRVVEQLAAGAVDIVVGTHRLVQADVTFKDLGLVVIDEEQRFGVMHKEKFKLMRTHVDVLTLSATPIPRTLYLALTGARDMSTIATPPQDRLPVETIVEHYDERVIRDAIRRELERGGQVFFLHNRVTTIEAMRARLASLVPQARIVVGHGQMSGDELEDVMTQFINGEADVLLSTTIIESGLDIPNANTLIIDRADRFGLSQLYQLRGRVGRYKHQAFAYLLLPRHARLLTDVRKRMSAIKQYAQLGSGFKIAMRDLEIRGAGNLLGAQQSGHITAVGFELYCNLLKQSVAALKGEKAKLKREVAMRLDFLKLHAVEEEPEVRSQESEEQSLKPGRAESRTTHHAPRTSAPISVRRDSDVWVKDWRTEDEGSEAPEPVFRIPQSGAFLPADFVPDSAQRIEAYRKLAQAETKAEVDALRQELQDRYGKIPKPVELLLLANELKLLAGERGLDAVETKGDKLMLHRRGDFIQLGGKFPRLTKTEPLAALKEMKKLLLTL